MPVILEFAAYRTERIAQGDERIFVPWLTRSCAAYRDHPIGKPDVDVEVVQGAMASVARWRCDDDVTVRDARIELLEARYQRADTARERGRGIYMAEGDLQRQLNICLLATAARSAPR